MEYGLIGEKLGHSFSKIIHNEICDYDYELKELSRDELATFMRKAEFKAINVTIPYKQSVIPFLDEIDEIAEKIGAVNTIVNKSGSLIGYNTDFQGMTAMILKAGINLKNKKVLILGTGGTSKTALCVAESMGAKSVLKVSRSGGATGIVTYDEAYSEHNDADIIINTTPCGMYPNIGESAVDINKFPNLSGVIDAVYNPLNSYLVCTAKEKGIPACGGLYMLVSQGVAAAEKFTGTQINSSETDRVYNKILLSKRNLVLIGMPSCGKSTVGKILANELDMQFVDSDEVITQKAGISIPEIFEKYGEEDFRKLESKVIAEISLRQNTVIATGGGAILNKRNIDLLKENGIVIFIDRPLENLLPTDDRPLSSDSEMLQKRYNERYSIYVSSAHAVATADGDVEDTKNKVKEMFLNENSCD